MKIKQTQCVRWDRQNKDQEKKLTAWYLRTMTFLEDVEQRAAATRYVVDLTVQADRFMNPNLTQDSTMFANSKFRCAIALMLIDSFPSPHTVTMGKWHPNFDYHL